MKGKYLLLEVNDSREFLLIQKVTRTNTYIVLVNTVLGLNYLNADAASLAMCDSHKLQAILSNGWKVMSEVNPKFLHLLVK